MTEKEARDQEDNDPVFHCGDSKTTPIRQNSGAHETLSQEDDSWAQAKYRFAGVCKFPERHKLLLDSPLVTSCVLMFKGRRKPRKVGVFVEVAG